MGVALQTCGLACPGCAVTGQFTRASGGPTRSARHPTRSAISSRAWSEDRSPSLGDLSRTALRRHLPPRQRRRFNARPCRRAGGAVAAVTIGAAPRPRQPAVTASHGKFSKIMACRRAEEDAALEPRSRRRHTSPSALAESTVALVLQLAKELAYSGARRQTGHHRLAPFRCGAVSVHCQSNCSRANSAREETPSLVKTLRRWKSMVRGLRNS